jgi:hypothetical protein
MDFIGPAFSLFVPTSELPGKASGRKSMTVELALNVVVDRTARTTPGLPSHRANRWIPPAIHTLRFLPPP